LRLPLKQNWTRTRSKETFRDENPSIRGSSIFGSFSWGGVSIAASPKKEKKRVATLMPGLGDVHHPVSTKNKQAQQFFDQGLKLIYGFNHDEARLAFERAAQLDPQLAMAWWGVALTLGPNYNLPVDPEREKAGYDAAQKAVALKENASEPERAYIDAIATRYSNEANPTCQHSIALTKRRWQQSWHVFLMIWMQQLSMPRAQ
jgi:tetratricopeptide (TPR) repeat protein